MTVPNYRTSNAGRQREALEDSVCAPIHSKGSPSRLLLTKATFALKAGAWLRRGRLLIVSPAPQPFWPCSGRNATYAVVQIRRSTDLFPETN